MKIRVRVAGPAADYAVRVERGLLARVGALVRPHAPGGRVLLVTDRTVGRLYGARVERSLKRAGLDVSRTTIPAGERAKSFAMARSLCERWAKEGAGRDALVVALGGGVVSDAAGFAAAVFGRGIPWVAVPTTLLAQADAAIGGKVGVNLAAGKNLVGAFHHPRAVLSDPAALSTLTARAIRSGLAEVVKMGVIRRPAILRRLWRLCDERRGVTPESAEPLVAACAAEKAWFVAQDERDRGLRLLLNFGHTVGHALETAEGYGRYQHGEAVSIGMVAAARLSVTEAGLDPISALEIEMLLRRLRLPTRLRRSPSSRFWSALERDKKRGRKGVRMVLCPAIGSAEVYELTSLTTLRQVVVSLIRRS